MENITENKKEKVEESDGVIKTTTTQKAPTPTPKQVTPEVPRWMTIKVGGVYEVSGVYEDDWPPPGI